MKASDHAAMTFDELPLELTSFLERESWMRVASSALYLDRCALRMSRQLAFNELLMHGECFQTIESLVVWLREPAGELPGLHAL